MKIKLGPMLIGLGVIGAPAIVVGLLVAGFPPLLALTPILAGVGLIAAGFLAMTKRSGEGRSPGAPAAAERRATAPAQVSSYGLVQIAWGMKEVPSGHGLSEEVRSIVDIIGKGKGEGEGGKGQWLARQLEDRHNYVQVLFPTIAASGTVGFKAALGDHVEEFKEYVHGDGRERFEKGALMMLKFWGFDAEIKGGELTITGYNADPRDPSQHASTCKQNWFTRFLFQSYPLFSGNRYDHNYKRMSRFMTSATQLGYPQWAQAFHQALSTRKIGDKYLIDRVPCAKDGKRWEARQFLDNALEDANKAREHQLSGGEAGPLADETAPAAPPGATRAEATSAAATSLSSRGGPARVEQPEHGTGRGTSPAP